MSLNAYVPQENGNLKHLAEADAEPDQVAEFIEVIQEEYPRQKDGPFVVMDLDAGYVVYVEIEEEPVTTVTRVLKIGGVAVNNGDGEAAAPKARRKAPAKTAAKTTAAKRTVKKAPAKAAASKTIKRSGSGFKRNARSAE